MPSLETIVLTAMLVALVICVWRFTSIVSHMVQRSERHDERNAAQRDRFVMQMLEKWSVQGNTPATLQVTNRHSAEHLQQHGMDLKRDASDGQGAKFAAMAKRELKNNLNPPAQKGTEKDAYQ